MSFLKASSFFIVSFFVSSFVLHAWENLCIDTNEALLRKLRQKMSPLKIGLLFYSLKTVFSFLEKVKTNLMTWTFLDETFSPNSFKTSKQNKIRLLFLIFIKWNLAVSRKYYFLNQCTMKNLKVPFSNPNVCWTVLGKTANIFPVIVILQSLAMLFKTKFKIEFWLQITIPNWTVLKSLCNIIFKNPLFCLIRRC